MAGYSDRLVTICTGSPYYQTKVIATVATGSDSQRYQTTVKVAGAVPDHRSRQQCQAKLKNCSDRLQWQPALSDCGKKRQWQATMTTFRHNDAFIFLSWRCINLLHLFSRNENASSMSLLVTKISLFWQWKMKSNMFHCPNQEYKTY